MVFCGTPGFRPDLNSNVPFIQTSWMVSEAVGRGNVSTCQPWITISNCQTTMLHANPNQERRG